ALLREAEIGGHFAICAEAGVERAIAVVAHQLEVVAPVDIGPARHDNLPIGLYGHRIRLGTDPETSGHFAICAAASLERAVAVLARHFEVVERVVNGPSRHDNLPSYLQGHSALSRASSRQ